MFIEKSNSSNNSCCLGLSFLSIIEAMFSIPYSSITDEVFIINKLLLEKVSNQCSNNLHRALIKSYNTKHGLENKNYFRIAVRSQVENGMLIEALKEIFD